MRRRIDWPVQSKSILRSRRRWAVFLLIIVVIAATVVLYNRPAHIFPVGADQSVWLRAVKAVDEDGRQALNTCIAPSTVSLKIAGLGVISSICTWGDFRNHPLKIRFVNNAGVGLLYMTHQLHEWSLQLGYCSYPLGGPWYQLTLTSDKGTSCLRGFSPLPTP
jgi:hypothetical protein